MSKYDEAREKLRSMGFAEDLAAATLLVIDQLEAEDEAKASIDFARQRDAEPQGPRLDPTTGCRRWGHHRNPNHGHCNRCGQEV